MNLSDAFKKLLVEEITFVIKKMEETKEATKLLYYFSAIPGMFQRIYNIEYDSRLVFAHFILKATHDSFSQRLKVSQQGGDNAVLINDDQFERLISLSKELLRNIKNNKAIDEVLQKLTILLYSTTGNGYFLMEKGWLKI
jgi:PHD/YefM family antitoxin component YafN of YafNO toxin-antitoxin module